jgi:hypothetical protein
MSYGKTETYKIVYMPLAKDMNNGYRGTAFIEAESRQQAMHNFQEQYRGQYHTIEQCEKLFG